MNCKEATRLLSESLDHPLTRGQRVALRLHLWICFFCRRYHRQVAFLGPLLRAYLNAEEREEGPPEKGLSEAARERILDRVRKEKGNR